MVILLKEMVCCFLILATYVVDSGITTVESGGMTIHRVKIGGKKGMADIR